MNTQIVAYPHNTMLLSHNKEWSTDMGHDMDEPWKHYTKWNKSDAKGHILRASIYMKYPDVVKKKKGFWGKILAWLGRHSVPDLEPLLEVVWSPCGVFSGKEK